MADQPQAENSMFLKAFLPGVILGVIVGMVVGMVVVPLFDRAPQVKPGSSSSRPVVPERDARPTTTTPPATDKPAEKPAEKPVETTPPAATGTAAPGSTPPKP